MFGKFKLMAIGFTMMAIGAGWLITRSGYHGEVTAKNIGVLQLQVPADMTVRSQSAHFPGFVGDTSDVRSIFKIDRIVFDVRYLSTDRKSAETVAQIDSRTDTEILTFWLGEGQIGAFGVPIKNGDCSRRFGGVWCYGSQYQIERRIDGKLAYTFIEVYRPKMSGAVADVIACYPGEQSADASARFDQILSGFTNVSNNQ